MKRRLMMLLAIAAALAAIPGRAQAPAQEQLSAVVEGNNRFAFDFLAKAVPSQGNALFSPQSLSSALAMASAGARGQTLQEMVKVLRLQGDGTPEAYQRFLKSLTSSKDHELNVANRLWGNRRSIYDKAFLETLRTHYLADLKSLDFQSHPEQSRVEINQWIEQQTRGKIRDLLPVGSITPDAELVLTSAVYFKGTWQTCFDKGLSRPGDFLSRSGSRTQTVFMHLKNSFLYAESAGFQLLELPYRGAELTLQLILPREGSPASLSYESYGGLLKAMHLEQVQLSIPRFKIEAAYDLANELAALGMPLAFDRARADFSGMRKLKAGERISISKVVHKAYAAIDEEGTEAAAATGIMMLRSAAPPTGTKTFDANRPFVFLIRHRLSGAILFLGRFERP